MNRYKTIYSWAMLLMLLSFMSSIGIMHIIIPDKTFSESENRVLEQRPIFSIQNLINGKYTERFEKYISDQFPGRNFWIGVKSDTERAIGKRENNEVLLGQNGYLFQKFNAPDKENISKKLKAIRSIALSLRNVHTYFTLVPTAIEILEEKLPAHAPVEDQKLYIDQIKNGLGNEVKFIDVYEELYARRDEYVYYKTDHHWTSRGAYYAYRSLAQVMGFTPLESKDFHIETVTDSFYGSLYSKSGFRRIDPDTLETYTPKLKMRYTVEYIDEGKTADSLYNMDNLQKKDKYTIFLDGNHPAIKITTNIGNNRKLLIIKDSYAHSIVPFLACHYEEIYLVDPRYYNGNIKNIVSENSIDDVLILYNVITFFEDNSLNNMLIFSNKK